MPFGLGEVLFENLKNSAPGLICFNTHAKRGDLEIFVFVVGRCRLASLKFGCAHFLKVHLGIVGLS